MSTSTLAHPQSQAIDNSTLLSLVTNGDCSRLTPDQKLQYYKARCDAAGLDPRCQPFEFIKFQGKEILYARKECSNQLASMHGVVCEVVDQKTEAGIRMVTVRSKTKDGRQTDEIGCVNVEGLKGNDLCNAFMKAVTKAKRRAILSICGLGLIDELELETMPTQELPTVAEKIRMDIDEDPSPKTIAARSRLDPRFTNGKWKAVEMHWETSKMPYKGKTLGWIMENKASHFRFLRVDWKPKPHNGLLDERSVDLRTALDVAHAEYEAAKTVQEHPKEESQEVEIDPKTGLAKEDFPF